ncbi:hypothetical protein [Micromonospora rosaria]|nr:hypothetical protein [Micromonospora rosaria]
METLPVPVGVLVSAGPGMPGLIDAPSPGRGDSPMVPSVAR